MMALETKSVPFKFFVCTYSKRALQRGVTSIEYALVGALIAMVIVGAVTSLGLTLEDFYSLLSVEVSKAVGQGG